MRLWHIKLTGDARADAIELDGLRQFQVALLDLRAQLIRHLEARDDDARLFGRARRWGWPFDTRRARLGTAHRAMRGAMRGAIRGAMRGAVMSLLAVVRMRFGDALGLLACALLGATLLLAALLFDPLLFAHGCGAVEAVI